MLIIYLQWAGKLFTASSQDNWSIIPKWHLSRLAYTVYIFYVNCKAGQIKGLNTIQNEFWKEVITTYLDNKNSRVTLEEIN